MGKSQREGGGKGKGRREGSVGKMDEETREREGGGAAAKGGGGSVTVEGKGDKCLLTI